MSIKLPISRRKKIAIDPKVIENYAANGLSQKAIAKELGVQYPYLNARLNESYTLMCAFKNGQARFLEKAKAESVAA